MHAGRLPVDVVSMNGYVDLPDPRGQGGSEVGPGASSWLLTTFGSDRDDWNTQNRPCTIRTRVSGSRGAPHEPWQDIQGLIFAE